MTEVSSAGLPHSDICGSRLICSSPQLFAAYHVFHRLLVPRHPPCALHSLTISKQCRPVIHLSITSVLLPYEIYSVILIRCVCLISRSLLILDLRCRFLIVVNLGLSLIKKSFISVFGFQGTKCQVLKFKSSGEWRWRDSNS